MNDLFWLGVGVVAASLYISLIGYGVYSIKWKRFKSNEQPDYMEEFSNAGEIGEWTFKAFMSVAFIGGLCVSVGLVISVVESLGDHP